MWSGGKDAGSESSQVSFLIVFYKIIEKYIDRVFEARKIKRKREREREREREIIVDREKRSKISI